MKPIPALLTLLFAAIVVAILLLVSLTPPLPPVKERTQHALLIEEELFIEPELVELGEQEAVNHDQPAPAVKGEPKPAPVEQPEVKVAAPEPKPQTPPAPKVATQKKESSMKTPPESANAKEVKEATSALASKFSSKNGNPSGNDAAGASGVGGTGIGIAGSAHGRTFQGCPKPDVTLRHKTVVKVNVVIDADGRVTEATATGSADASIRRKCEAAARAARWSPKSGAAPTRGTLTFTISPK